MSRIAHTRLTITDIKVSVDHTNDVGIKVDGKVIIGVRVKYKRFTWQKAYGILQKDLKDFNLDEFKNKIYRESRVWIREKELEKQVLKAVEERVGEEIKLD